MARPQALFFDNYVLLPRQRRLICAGADVPLRARAFDLLLALVERAGDVVTKADLLTSVWAGVIVEENNIAAQVAALRKALPGNYIVTVPGRGYRFTASPQTRASPLASHSLTVAAGHALIGRAEERSILVQALVAGACVTLIGAGGVGKTALAQSVASMWATGRMAWVDLAAITDERQLPHAMGRALELQTVAGDIDQAIVQALSEGLPLLVFDNAEHLRASVAAWVRKLRRALPRLALLVTSQVPLRAVGEEWMPLEPLALPAAEADGDEVFAAPAVAMLVDRIHVADPRFTLGADAAPLLSRICRQLDGLPLALEMAAARAPILGLQGLLDALDHRLALLRRGRRTPARHETMRAALDWSHGLLGDAERRLFRRLGVFAADFSLHLAVEVGGDVDADRWDVVDRLSILVEQGLVTSLHVDPPRYRLLETMRSYAVDQLRSNGEFDRVHGRLVAALTEVLSGRTAGKSDSRVTAELGLVGSALAWAREADPTAATKLAVGAAQPATHTIWFGESMGWVASCEPLLDSVAPELQARWWRDLARIQTFHHGSRILEAARRAQAIYRDIGDDVGVLFSIFPQLRSSQLGDEEARACCDEALALSERHPEWPAYYRVVLHGSLAIDRRRQGDHAGALAEHERSFDLAREAGLTLAADAAEDNVAADLIELGRADEALERIDLLLGRLGDKPTPNGAWASKTRLDALIALGRLDAAAAVAPQVLRWCRQFDVDTVFDALGRLASLQGRHRAAVQCFGYRRQLLAQRGCPPRDAETPNWRRSLAAATAALGAPMVRGLLERGERLDAAAVDPLLSGESG